MWCVMSQLWDIRGFSRGFIKSCFHCGVKGRAIEVSYLWDPVIHSRRKRPTTIISPTNNRLVWSFLLDILFFVFIIFLFFSFDLTSLRIIY